MNHKIFQHIHQGLSEKRDKLTAWLQATPPQKKQVSLGPLGEQAIQSHLHVLDTALTQATAGTLGVCTVCHDYIETARLEMDYTACVCLDHLSPQERDVLESELKLAQDVQKSLLPQQPPTVPDLDIAAFSRPAQIVGGDYFDFFQFSNGAQGFVIADVEGHGIAASLYMATVQALLRTLMPSSASPAKVMQQLHHLLIHNIRFSTFVTLFIGAFDHTTHRLTYCNAGHNPPLIFRGDRDALLWLRPTGAAVGLIEGFEFKEETCELLPDDILLLYTDGITEAFNPEGEEFKGERLAELVRRGANLPAKELVQAIRQGLQTFTAGKPFADDTTVVVCKVIH
jgi:sigma-B regulation protein RsbU (phosphoserine phosphatase)